MNKKELGSQAILAMEFIEKLYFEISYLIREMEGLLKREEEKFEIGRSKGYAISAPSSTGIEYPDWWWYKKFSVCFIPKAMTKIVGGRTNTDLSKDLKVIYTLFNLYNSKVKTPKVVMGTIEGFENTETRYFHKFEETMNFSIDPILSKLEEHPDFKPFICKHKNYVFKGKFKEFDLFEIESTGDIQEKLLNPILKVFRGS